MIARLAEKDLGWRLATAAGQPAQIGRQLLKGRLLFACEGLAQDLAVLGFSGAAMASGSMFEPSDQLVIQIAYMQIPRHSHSPR